MLSRGLKGIPMPQRLSRNHVVKATYSTALSLPIHSNQNAIRRRRVVGALPLIPRHDLDGRAIHLPTMLAPPLIFIGLFMGLWLWKCTMLILFQNMIIYNPFLPPNARTFTIAEYAKQCRGIAWREEIITSLDGTQLSLCVSEFQCDKKPGQEITRVYILYMQGANPATGPEKHAMLTKACPGNASSLPPRLPDISSILRKIQASAESLHVTTVCVSYRGYWKSHDRPSEKGINQDMEAARRWIDDLHNERSKGTSSEALVLLWGQSIGCGFATNLAATSKLPSDALILETPFTSTRAMLKALYPQTWLPYQYLWPFLRNYMDSWTNLETMARRSTAGDRPGIYMVEAGKDELVPASHGEELFRRCQDVGLPVQRHKVRNALHNDASVREEGKTAIAQSILMAIDIAQKRCHT